MGLAIKAGRRARVWSSPNPAVGCAIVKDDEVLATGFTHPEGQAHAEVHALSQVADAMGSTVYVTLEPCAHTGRTPPCTQALIDAGVSRVVIACIDPDERVAGKGVDQLRSAGIDVALGVCSAEAAEDLAGFFSSSQARLRTCHRKNGDVSRWSHCDGLRREPVDYG